MIALRQMICEVSFEGALTAMKRDSDEANIIANINTVLASRNVTPSDVTITVGSWCRFRFSGRRRLLRLVFTVIGFGAEDSLDSEGQRPTHWRPSSAGQVCNVSSGDAKFWPICLD